MKTGPFRFEIYPPFLILLQAITGGKERPDLLGQALREKNRHWDFLLKEMMWMADDFQQERKRHMVREIVLRY